MSLDNNPLASVELDKYARWARRMMGSPEELVFFDEQGKSLWPEKSDSPALPAELLEKMTPGVQRLRLDQGETLLYRQLRLPSSPLCGIIGCRLSHEAESLTSRVDEIAEILSDIALGVEDECASQHELDSMAMELGERYDEMNLLFDLDQPMEKADVSANRIQGLLEDTAAHMNVDLVCYVEPGNNITYHASNLSAPISNLDLVLVQLRGDLYRFLSSTKQTLVLNEMEDQKRSYIFRNMPFKILACPVFSGTVVKAALVLINHLSKPDFYNSDRKICEAVTTQVTALVQLRSMMLEMNSFNVQMAAALIESVEAKDPYTRGHSERVCFYSLEIGKALQLPAKEMDNLYWGSLLHDVGKIGVPDSVLTKPARLTEDEYFIIRVHPERSYEILRHIDRLKDAVPAARYHQEMFDGSGYPFGLSGKEIPLLARIVAVADIYDSMTSSRAYRPGRTHESTVQEIQRVSGTQLDPDIANVFVKLCEGEPEWLKKFDIRRENGH